MNMKKLICLTLTLLMFVSVFTVFGAVEASAATTGYDRGYKGSMAGTGKILAEGLDISEHQKGMSIQKIKDAGFDYVIIRAGVKLNAGNNRKDYCFEDFYAAARRAGLDIGTYFYSQAKTVDEAKEEAKAFISYIKGKTFEYPVYLDFESNSVRDALGSNAAKATQICYAFMDTMRDAGYLVGLYGYAAWFDPGYGGWMGSKLDGDIGKKYEFWMANYFNNMLPENDRTSNYKNKYGMYQYTSSKTISGWSGKLDHNVCYKDYPSIVKKYGFNGYGSNVAKVIKYDTTKSVIKTTTTLKKGSTNTEQIAYLQKALYVLSYYNGQITGEYDTATANAVRSFQKAKSLSSNGEAGKDTLKALVEDVMYAEAALKYLGYYGSTPNADADGLLIAAIKAFQKAEKLTVSGFLNKSTKSRLDEKIELKADGSTDKSTQKPTVATMGPDETDFVVETKDNANDNTNETDAEIGTDAPTDATLDVNTEISTDDVTDSSNTPVETDPIITDPLYADTSGVATLPPNTQVPDSNIATLPNGGTQQTTTPTVGCGASIGAGAIMLVAISGAALVIKKKKED